MIGRKRGKVRRNKHGGKVKKERWSRGKISFQRDCWGKTGLVRGEGKGG